MAVFGLEGAYQGLLEKNANTVGAINVGNSVYTQVPAQTYHKAINNL